MNNLNKRKLIIILIEGVLGLLHFIGIGRHSNNALYILSASYFSDLSIPFGFYFLLKLIEDRISLIKKWWVKASIIFLMAALSEIGQYFGLAILGRTFDPFDIVVYAFGVLLAAFVDCFLLTNLKFWNNYSGTRE